MYNTHEMAERVQHLTSHLIDMLKDMFPTPGEGLVGLTASLIVVVSLVAKDNDQRHHLLSEFAVMLSKAASESVDIGAAVDALRERATTKPNFVPNTSTKVN